MEKIVSIVQANVVCFTALFLAITFLSLNPLFNKTKNRLFLFVFVLNILMILVTSLDAYLEVAGPQFYILRRITSFLNFACGPIIPLVLCRIFDDKKMHTYAYIPIIINIFVCFISIFCENIVFHISIYNKYDRGVLFLLPMLISCFYMIMLIVKPVNHRLNNKHIERIFVFFVLTLILFSAFLEVAFKMKFMNWNFSGMSLILYYLLLNIQVNITDQLTGCANRRLYDSTLNDMNHHDNCILVLVDINNFKQINDTYGHDVGDKCLVYFTTIFTTMLTKNSTLYRIGGDEFMVIAKKQTIESVTKEIEDIRNFLNKNNLDFAYGIESYHRSFDILDAQIEADKKMYLDKNTRKPNLDLHLLIEFLNE